MLHMRNVILVGMTSVVASCGLFNKDDDRTESPAPTKPTFELTGTETSNLSVDALTAKVRGEKILKNFQLTQFKIADRVVASVGKISSGKDASFSACVRSYIENSPLNVTRDSVSYSINADFISLCDVKREESDTSSIPVNTLVATMTYGCSNGDTSGLKDKLVKDLNLEGVCGDATLVTYSHKLLIKAEKAVTTGDATVGASQSTVTSVVAEEIVSSVNGQSCVLRVIDKRYRAIDSCRIVSQSKTYEGDPAYLKNSPNDSVIKGPTVNQSVITIQGAQIDNTAPYYSSATTTFAFNGWEGSVRYDNAWVAPKWSAKHPDSVLKAFGSL